MSIMRIVVIYDENKTEYCDEEISQTRRALPRH